MYGDRGRERGYGRLDIHDGDGDRDDSGEIIVLSHSSIRRSSPSIPLDGEGNEKFSNMMPTDSNGPVQNNGVGSAELQKRVGGPTNNIYEMMKSARPLAGWGLQDGVKG